MGIARSIMNRFDLNSPLNWGRDIIAAWSAGRIRAANGQAVRILDIGCGTGDDLMRVVSRAGGHALDLHGIEGHAPYRERCRSLGIDAVSVDIEKDVFPYANGTFDIVIINQVIEHTKEIFWIFSEISRVLKEGGTLIVGVPNLAAFHERLFLLLGRQPRCIKVLGPHIRGYTRSGFASFIESGGYFTVRRVRGSHFWPFPAFMNGFFGRVFPSFCWALFFEIRRNVKPGLFVDVLEKSFFETNFYAGRKPAAVGGGRPKARKRARG